MIVERAWAQARPGTTIGEGATMRCRGGLVGAVGLVVTAAVLGGVRGAVAAPSSTTVQLLPDLRMKRPAHLSVDTHTLPGHKLLRFDGTIVNVGAGPFEVFGSRPDTAQQNMSVDQVIHAADGTTTSVPTSAVMHFETADGHDHWHVQNFERGVLTRVGGSRRVGALAKQGFCLEDDSVYNLQLPGAPADPVYTYCGRFHPELLSLTEGISVGYGDKYPAGTNLQWVDITGLPAGKYQLTLTADPLRQFTESNTTNNNAWVQIRYDGNTAVSIIKVGPGA